MRASPVNFAGPKRHNAPVLRSKRWPPIDGRVVSHGHYDHLELATLSKLGGNSRRVSLRRLAYDVTMRAPTAAIKAEGSDWHQRVELAAASRDAGADPALVSARIVRSQQALGKLVRRRRQARSTSSAIRLTARASYFRRVAERMAIAAGYPSIGAYEPRWVHADQHMNPETP